MILAGTVFDGGDVALFFGLAGAVVLLVVAVVFVLGWAGGRTLGRK